MLLSPAACTLTNSSLAVRSILPKDIGTSDRRWPLPLIPGVDREKRCFKSSARITAHNMDKTKDIRLPGRAKFARPGSHHLL